MTNPLQYIVTHGKVARCWHEWYRYYSQQTAPATPYYQCRSCLESVKYGEQYNPTATLDYLVQRCEEEFGRNNYEIEMKSDACRLEVHVGHRILQFYGLGLIPHEGLLTALARSLGWEGE